MDLPVYKLEKSPWSTTDALLLVCLSLCTIVFLTITDTETFGSHCTTDGMLWLTYNVTYCVFFAIDHVLVCLVNLLKTTATTGAIFSLQFTKNRLAARLRPNQLGELKRSTRSPSHNRGPTSKRREGRKGEGRGRRKEGTGKEEMEG